MIWSFYKNGVVFYFRNPKLDKYNNFICEYKISGYKENRSNDGYYLNSELNVNSKIITFATVKIGDKSVGGVHVPEDIFGEMVKRFEELKEERRKKIGEIVDDIISGSVLIDWKIVGCDYPYYQPWLNELPDNLKGLEQNIMEKAICKLTGEKHISSPCEYMEKKLRQDISTSENMSEKACNLEFNKKTQEYHGYIDSVVTNFQTKLSDVVYVENIEKRQDTEKIIDPKFISLHLEIISSGEENGSDGSDYFAKVKVSDKDTGESLKFICRNIFDFGYVVNPLYKIAEGIDGGVSNEGNWEVFESSKGWYPVRKLSEFETRCLDYLNKFPPITKKIRL